MIKLKDLLKENVTFDTTSLYLPNRSKQFETKALKLGKYIAEKFGFKQNCEITMPSSERYISYTFGDEGYIRMEESPSSGRLRLEYRIGKDQKIKYTEWEDNNFPRGEYTADVTHPQVSGGKMSSSLLQNFFEKVKSLDV